MRVERFEIGRLDQPTRAAFMPAHPLRPNASRRLTTRLPPYWGDVTDGEVVPGSSALPSWPDNIAKLQ